LPRGINKRIGNQPAQKIFHIPIASAVGHHMLNEQAVLPPSRSKALKPVGVAMASFSLTQQGGNHAHANDR
jgi:hypothetical protein